MSFLKVCFPLEVTYRQEVKFRVAGWTTLYFSFTLTKLIPVSLVAKLDTIHMILKDKRVKTLFSKLIYRL